MARQVTANTIINDVALEVGLAPVNDPLSSSDPAFIQLAGLLNTAGRELVDLHDWQTLREVWEFTTDAGVDTGIYDLPADFSHMIQQTEWDNTNGVPVGGPLSPQDWSYLEGTNLAKDTIYVSYRLAEDKLELYTQPPPDGVTLRFEYISIYWVKMTGSSTRDADSVVSGSDTVLYDRILMQKFLKAKFLEAKGFDATAARLEFETLFLSRAGKDEGAPILSADRTGRRMRYLDAFNNTSDTRYGI